MNCINHPEIPVAAYCQNCGKALCQECVRSIGGVVYCESCLAARLNHPGAGPAPNVPGTGPYIGLPPTDGPNPGLALGLGFIPGVGAMYNGQFVKGTVHVLVFALLCSIANHADFFGILIPFWIAYQVFDAYQTAKARRDGLPLPNPFGLNDLGYRLGLVPHPETPVTAPPPFAGQPYTGQTAPTPGVPFTPTPGAGTEVPPFTPFSTPGQGFGYPPSGNPPMAGFVSQSDPTAPPVTPVAQIGRSQVPVGAIVLIGFGTLFLLSSMGVFRDEWIGRAWPLVLVGIGVWLIIRRMRETQGGRGL
jgi:TM2 domain-containing membrane protein YozV